MRYAIVPRARSARLALDTVRAIVLGIVFATPCAIAAAPSVTGVTPAADSIRAAGTVHVTIDFDQAMDAAVQPVVLIRFPDGSTKNATAPSWASANRWRGEIAILAADPNGAASIEISGARSATGENQTSTHRVRIKVDTLPPVVDSALRTPASVAPGQALSLRVEFFDPVSGVDFGVAGDVRLRDSSGATQAFAQRSFAGDLWTGDATVPAGFTGASADIEARGFADRAGNAIGAWTRVGSVALATRPAVSFAEAAGKWGGGFAEPSAPGTARGGGRLHVRIVFDANDPSGNMDYATDPAVQFVIGGTTIAVAKTSYTGQGWFGQADIPGSIDGTGRIDVDLAKNASGAQMAAAAGVATVHVDSTAPRLVSLDASPRTVRPGDRVRIAIRFEDPVANLVSSGLDNAVRPRVEVALPGGGAGGVADTVAWSGEFWDGAYTVPMGAAEGEARISATLAQDRAGNSMAAAANAGSFTIDATAPRVDLVVAPEWIGTAEVELRVRFTEAMDTTAPLEVTVERRGTILAPVRAVSFVDREWTGRVRLDRSVASGAAEIAIDLGQDLAGNAMARHAHAVKVDTIAPVVSARATPDPARQRKELLVSVTAQYTEGSGVDAGKVAARLVDPASRADLDLTLAPAGANFESKLVLPETWPAATGGPWRIEIHVEAADRAGNAAPRRSAGSFTLEPSGPAASIEATPGVVGPGSELQVSIRVAGGAGARTEREIRVSVELPGVSEATGVTGKFSSAALWQGKVNIPAGVHDGPGSVRVSGLEAASGGGQIRIPAPPAGGHFRVTRGLVARAEAIPDPARSGGELGITVSFEIPEGEIDRTADPTVELVPAGESSWGKVAVAGMFEGDRWFGRATLPADFPGGPAEIRVSGARTKAGVWNEEEEVAGRFVVDAAAPRLSWTHPAGAEPVPVRGDVALEVRVEDEAPEGARGTLAIRFRDQTSDDTFGWSVAGPDGRARFDWATYRGMDGERTVRASTLDAAGHEAFAERRILIDNLPPEFVRGSASPESLAGGALVVELAFEDRGSGIDEARAPRVELVATRTGAAFPIGETSFSAGRWTGFFPVGAAVPRGRGAIRVSGVFDRAGNEMPVVREAASVQILEPGGVSGWPFAPTNQAHPIWHSYGHHLLKDVGEYYFHEGLDLHQPAGTPVFALFDGSIRYLCEVPMTAAQNSLMTQTVGGATDNLVGYMHIDWRNRLFDRRFARDERIFKGQQIGVVATYGIVSHLHLTWERAVPHLHDIPAPDPTTGRYYISGAWFHGIRFRGDPFFLLAPNDDATRPSVRTPFFFRHAADENVAAATYEKVDVGSTRVVYGDVDVIARAAERFSTFPSHLGVQRIGMEIRAVDGPFATGFDLLKVMDGELIPNGNQEDMRDARFARVIYEVDHELPYAERDNERDEPGWDGDPYILTNRDDDTLLERTDEDQCWNTNAPSGSPWRVDRTTAAATNAPLAERALSPDGLYRIRVVAADEKGNTDEASQEVLLDNFAAYTRKVVVKQGSRTIYEAGYDFDAGTDQLRQRRDSDRVADASADLSIEIEFSEDLEANPTVTLAATSGPNKDLTLVPRPDGQRRKFAHDTLLTKAELASRRFDEPTNGRTISIVAKERWVDREADADPRTIARHRNAEGLAAFDRLDAGPDTLHRIKIQGTRDRKPVPELKRP